MSLTANDVTNIINECNNSISDEQINKIISGPECMKEYTEMCKILSTEDNKMKCIKDMPKIQNISQSNVSTIKSNCVVNQIIDKMSKQNATVENIAKLLAMQEASGLGQKGNNITNNCNEVNQNISSSNFLDAVSKCVNKVNAKQKNIIKTCGGASNIAQSNVSDMMNDCLVASGVKVVNDQSGNIKNTTDIDLKQKASNTVILIVIAIVVAIVAIVGVTIAIKYYGGKVPAK